MAHILLVDDEPQICRILALVLSERGFTVDVVASGELALEAAARTPPDLALIDVSLPGMTGLETFTALRARQAGLSVVFITAFGSIRSAIAAMRAGAFDYITKPFDNDELLLTIDRALELRQLGEEVKRLREDLSSRVAFPGIIGTSRGIQEALRVLTKAAATDATVLILGESGTGKELVARSLHRHSRRASKPFVAVNSSAIPAGLVESEFFGHERGAFTDAKDLRIGRFEQANGGTLFLDEVGDLPLEAQAKLLRVLEDHEVTRVGARKAVSVDVRLVAATNKNLEEAVATARFREDLYWRLNVVNLYLPPLRERREDLPLLIDHFVDRLNVELQRQVTGFSPEAGTHLLSHDWPGNVRELENALRRAIIFAEGPIVQVSDLPRRLSAFAGLPSDDQTEPARLSDIVSRAVERLERTLIETTLKQHHGNRTATADALGINRKTLFNKLRSYGFVDATLEDPSD